MKILQAKFDEYGFDNKARFIRKQTASYIPNRFYDVVLIKATTKDQGLN